MPNIHPSSAYGIDFGTSNSTVSVAADGRVRVLDIEALSENSKIIRTILYFHSHTLKRSFGKEAVDSYLEDIALGRSSEKVVIHTGRYVKMDKPTTVSGWAGTEMVPELIEVDAGDAGRLIQSLKSGLGSEYINRLRVFDKQYSITKIISMFIGEMKKRADKIVGADVENVVLGRPVNFVGTNNNLAVKRLQAAAKLAGFKNIVFEMEPVGAAWSYGITQKKQTCLVFDFGGGTLDFSLVNFPEREVILNDGLPIGGDLINGIIFEKKIFKYFGGAVNFGEHKQSLPTYLESSLKNWYLISLLKSRSILEGVNKLRIQADDPQAIDNLYSLIENNLGFLLYEEINRVKRLLSEKTSVIFSFSNKNIQINETITRSEFEDAIRPILTEIEEKVDNILQTANLKPDDIDVVVATGGSSLIPAVQKMLTAKFSNSQIKKENVFTSVGRGLGVKALEIFG